MVLNFLYVDGILKLHILVCLTWNCDPDKLDDTLKEIDQIMGRTYQMDLLISSRTEMVVVNTMRFSFTLVYVQKCSRPGFKVIVV